MKIEISKTLSRLIIGENQLSVRYLGYEIMKKVRAILSPKFMDFESILSAEGAMTSCSSRLADLYIASGKTAKVEALASPPLPVVFFFSNNVSKIPILFNF